MSATSEQHLPPRYRREQHAADWSAWLGPIIGGRGNGKWLVVFDGREDSCWHRREDARYHIRQLKRAACAA